MENTNQGIDLLARAVSRCVSFDSTIEGPLEAKNNKMFFKAKFKVVTEDDDGYVGQSKLYTKCFFEDTHSFLYMEAQRCLDNDIPMKIKAGRIIIPTDKQFYILDENGEKMKKKNGDYRKGSSITLFLIADENWQTAFNAACDQISDKNAWITVSKETDETDIEDITANEGKETPNTKKQTKK